MSPGNGERGPTGAPPDQQHHVHHDVRASVDDAVAIPEQLRRRRDASYRLPPLESGVRDPWRDTPPRPSEANTAASRRAWDHLRAVGLTSESVLIVLREAA